jgi:hypothetical protein
MASVATIDPGASAIATAPNSRSNLAVRWSDVAASNSPRREHTVLLDPLTHPGWDSLVAGHSESSFFHGRAWARVLQESYGHRPFYFCRLVNGELEELLPVMEVSSPWTGRRGVSLPFTDFCGLLRTRDVDGARLHNMALEKGPERNWRYLECRTRRHEWPGSSPALVFYGHSIALDRGRQTLFNGFKSATQRNVRRAEASGLQIAFDNSQESMRDFYWLHNLTRRRHGVPPQGFKFFEYIRRHVLEPGHGFIVTVRTGKLPVAAAVYFCHGRQAIFKFGASNYAFQHLRPNNLVMWEAIKRLAADGFTSLHLGRTSLSNEGLRRYKLGFGAREEKIEYCRYDFLKRAFTGASHPAGETSSRVFYWLPLPLLRLAGRLLYSHLC